MRCCIRGRVNKSGENCRMHRQISLLHRSNERSFRAFSQKNLPQYERLFQPNLLILIYRLNLQIGNNIQAVQGLSTNSSSSSNYCNKNRHCNSPLSQQFLDWNRIRNLYLLVPKPRSSKSHSNNTQRTSNLNPTLNR